MAMSKAFAGVELPADFKLQRCGHKFRATGKASICPHASCRTNAKAKGRTATRRPVTIKSPIDAAVSALVLASEGALDAIQARIEIERILLFS